MNGVRSCLQGIVPEINDPKIAFDRTPRSSPFLRELRVRTPILFPGIKTEHERWFPVDRFVLFFVLLWILFLESFYFYVFLVVSSAAKLL